MLRQKKIFRIKSNFSVPTFFFSFLLLLVLHRLNNTQNIKGLNYKNMLMLRNRSRISRAISLSTSSVLCILHIYQHLNWNWIVWKHYYGSCLYHRCRRHHHHPITNQIMLYKRKMEDII